MIELAAQTSAPVPVVLSMLHESVLRNSATRLFRNQPVLRWTLRRLRQASQVGACVVLCWDDQQPAVQIACDEGIEKQAFLVHSIGTRRGIASVDAVTVARRWADGWRGGLLQTCEFDRGFHAPSLLDVINLLATDIVLCVDPASGLVDASLVDTLVRHARVQSHHDLVFSPATPGACGVLLRRRLIESLASGNTHPGRALHYVPDHPILDPLGREASAPTPTPVARTPHRLSLDSDRQISRLSDATEYLNGQLTSSSALQVLELLSVRPQVDRWPREIVLEIEPTRATRPVYAATTHRALSRVSMSPAKAALLFDEVGVVDDLRIVFGGCGDALLNPHFFDIVSHASNAGVPSISVETDLLGVSAQTIERLATSPVDVVSVYVPAMTPATYKAVMGVDGLTAVIENIRLLVHARHAAGRVAPLVVPTFVKCLQNQGEMEVWYDQWIRALGHAVVCGPTDYAGQIPDVAVSDVSPPRRRACARIQSRLTILSDGTIVPCEQDVLGTMSLGEIGQSSIQSAWSGRMRDLRADHACGQWTNRPLCAGCREWHRP